MNTPRLNNCVQQESVKLAYLNARLVPCHVDNIRFLMHESGIDLLLVSETWIHSNTPLDMFYINGYTVHKVDREGKRAGGVAIYVANHLSSHKIDTPLLDPLQQLWLEVKLKSTNIAVGVIYRPPSTPYKCFDNFQPTL